MDGTAHAAAAFGLLVALPCLFAWAVTRNADFLIGTYMFGWLSLLAPFVWRTELLSNGSLRHSSGYTPFVKVRLTGCDEVAEVLLRARSIRDSRFFELSVRTQHEVRLQQYQEAEDDKALRDGQEVANTFGVPFSIDPGSKRLLYEWRSSRPRRIVGYKVALAIGLFCFMTGAALHLSGTPSEDSLTMVTAVNGTPWSPSPAVPKPTIVLYLLGIALSMIGFGGWMSLRPKS